MGALVRLQLILPQRLVSDYDRSGGKSPSPETRKGFVPDGDSTRRRVIGLAHEAREAPKQPSTDHGTQLQSSAFQEFPALKKRSPTS